jgi:hypothetical protein
MKIGSSKRSILGFSRVEGWVLSRSKGIFFGTKAGFVLVQPGTTMEELGMEGFLELASTTLLWGSRGNAAFNDHHLIIMRVTVGLWHQGKTTSRKLMTKH